MGQAIRGEASGGEDVRSEKVDTKALLNGEAGCYDDATETLTSEGWMGLDDLRRRVLAR